MADSEKPVPEQDQPPAELATPPPAKQTIEATEAEIEYLHKLRLERQQRQPSPPKKARLPPDEQGWAEFFQALQTKDIEIGDLDPSLVH